MNINEVLKMSDRALMEDISASNDSGISNQDLLEVARVARDGDNTYKPMTLEEIMAFTQSL